MAPDTATASSRRSNAGLWVRSASGQDPSTGSSIDWSGCACFHRPTRGLPATTSDAPTTQSRSRAGRLCTPRQDCSRRSRTTYSPVGRSRRESPLANACSDPAGPFSRRLPASPRVWAQEGLLRPGHRLRMGRSSALLVGGDRRPDCRVMWRLVGPNDGAERPRHETRDEEE